MKQISALLTSPVILIIALVITGLGAGCSVPVVQPPNVIIQDAHIGGNSLGFNHDSTLLASGGMDGIIKLWTLPDGKLVRQWQAHDDPLEAIVFVQNSQRIVTASFDATIAEWTLQGKLIRRIKTATPITHMVLDEASQVMITGHNDGAVNVWRYPELTLVKTYQKHIGPIAEVAWHAGTQQLASSGEDRHVYVWKRGRQPARLPRPPSYSRTLAFSPDGRYLMGGGWNDIYRWDLNDRSMKVMETVHGGIINSVQYSRDGKSLLSISRQMDSAVNILDPQTGVLQKRLQPHDLCGVQALYSPDERYIATTSDDFSVRIWDMENPLTDVDYY